MAHFSKTRSRPIALGPQPAANCGISAIVVGEVMAGVGGAGNAGIEVERTSITLGAVDHLLVAKPISADA